MNKHFLSITDITKEELNKIFCLAKNMKEQMILSGENMQYLKNKTLAMIFEKPSLRTRLSFEAGMTQLGGHAIYLSPSDIDMGKREPIKDVSAVTSSMVDIIMARTFKHETVVELAKYSSVPVINALSDLEHPCQILADLLTILEFKKQFKGLKVVFVGDGENNVTHSLALGCAMLGVNFVCSSPKDYSMNMEILKKAKKIAKITGANISEITNPFDAVDCADVVYTDTWVSMGDEAEKAERLKTFASYQVTQKLMDRAMPDALFMHDMPAYRGNEVTPEVIDGSQSVAYHQAENRLHAQKALLVFLSKSPCLA